MSRIDGNRKECDVCGRKGGADEPRWIALGHDTHFCDTHHDLLLVAVDMVMADAVKGDGFRRLSATQVRSAIKGGIQQAELATSGGKYEREATNFALEQLGFGKTQ